jgi:hypothetical protein
VIALEDIDEIPQDLAGIWAYMMWEYAGCPNRSQQDADREYQLGIQEMQHCLCRGKTIADLREVAEGKMSYAQFKRDFIDVGKEPERLARKVQERIEPRERDIEPIPDTQDLVEVEKVRESPFVASHSSYTQ